MGNYTIEAIYHYCLNQKDFGSAKCYGIIPNFVSSLSAKFRTREMVGKVGAYYAAHSSPRATLSANLMNALHGVILQLRTLFKMIELF